VSNCPSLVLTFVFLDMNRMWVHPFGCLSKKNGRRQRERGVCSGRGTHYPHTLTYSLLTKNKSFKIGLKSKFLDTLISNL
jgi:hypothetical protein